ncbi:hypothetical protein GB937_008946 [Aspergillus fischeri]|nr:hypothetical protein GB937_008946 [Aspergillus fischeri]
MSAGGAKSRCTLMAEAYSNPVKFGAIVVEIALGDPDLKVQWEAYLISYAVAAVWQAGDYGICGDWSFIA